MNGVAERLWAELSLTFVYLKNRSPHSSLDFKVPYVKWKQRRLSLRHLKRPGAKCFVHHTAPGRGKLEDRAWIGVLVGYAFGTRGYRVWDPATDRVVQTKHVKIDETIVYKHFGRQQEVDSLQTADSSPVSERNWPKPLSDSSDDSSSTDSDDDSPAPVMTTPERNLLLATIPDATSVEDRQKKTIYVATATPVLPFRKRGTPKPSTPQIEFRIPRQESPLLGKRNQPTLIRSISPIPMQMSPRFVSSTPILGGGSYRPSSTHHIPVGRQSNVGSPSATRQTPSPLRQDFRQPPPFWQPPGMPGGPPHYNYNGGVPPPPMGNPNIEPPPFWHQPPP
uniref:Retroviral polymerase SH3-like domain-containing protein n=1 Tax=Strigamia maritima TaxID=126957 RepID=T1IKV0_STRMM